MKRPSPAMTVALLSLFVALGGVGIAANGDGLILGSQDNTATLETSISAPVNDKALQIDNKDTGTRAAALGLTVAIGHPPIVVNRGAGKAPYLNADLVDGYDGSDFVECCGFGGRVAFFQAHRRILVGQRWDSNFPVQAPNAPFTLTYRCPSTSSSNGEVDFFNGRAKPADVLADNGGSNPVYRHEDGFAGFALPTAATGEAIEYQGQWDDGSVATVWFSSVHVHNQINPTQSTCRIQVMALVYQ